MVIDFAYCSCVSQKTVCSETVVLWLRQAAGTLNRISLSVKVETQLLPTHVRTNDTDVSKKTLAHTRVATCVAVTKPTEN